MNQHPHDSTCACGCQLDRREFLAIASAAFGGMTLAPMIADAAESAAAARAAKQGATVRVAFLYPPSKTFKTKSDDWWSWPGNDYDAEGRQKQYAAALRKMEQKLGVKLVMDDASIADDAGAQRLEQELEAQKPDGLLLVMFYNRSLAHADLLLKAADKLGIPAIFYIGLGVKHGPVAAYRRPGVYFIQSLENLDAIESGLRMIQTKKLMAQSKLLSVTDVKKPAEIVEAFFGTKISVIPFERYADEFGKVAFGAEARRFIARFSGGAKSKQGITKESLENAARAHLTLKKLLAEERADGVAMTCLRRGMLKPCMSFSALNSALVPAICENDLPAAYGQLLGQLLLGQPGFQHNPCYDTERNHYYASHCTCATRMRGPAGPELPYLLRRFAHTNEGSCAIQVFWKDDEPVTMIHYYPGKEPMLDVYAGRVVKSHAMPPAGGCTTNVEVAITDREDACMVKGHHNLLFSGDHARKFRLFAQLHKLKLAESGFKSPWPL
jgi:hypothetical protein